MENAKPISTPLANHFHLSTLQCPRTVKETERHVKGLIYECSGVSDVCYDMYQARFGSCS
jgi:hypothetical protein